MKVAIDKRGERTQMIVAIEMLEAINQAKGGAEQLCFQRRDPRFLFIRDGLEAMKSLCMVTLPQSLRKGEREKKTLII